MGTFLGNRWDVDYTRKAIFRDTTETPTVTDTTLALYSALQDLFDEPDQMDNPVPMSAQTPTAFTLINQWFIDDESTQYLTGGALATSGWASGEIRAISFDATGAGTMFATSDIGLTITGTTTGDTGTIMAFDERYASETGVVWIRPDDPVTDLFDDASTEAFTTAGSGAGDFTDTYAAASGGGVASETGESLWTNVFTLGTIFANTTLYIYQDGAELIGREVGATNRWWSAGQIDILVKVLATSVEIDDAEITVFARQYGSAYDNFIIDLTTGGRQPVPLATGADLNNATGLRRQVVSVGPTGQFTVGEVIEDDSDDTIQGIVTASSGTPPDLTIDYYLIGPALADFSGATGQFTGQTSAEVATAVAPTDIGPAALGTDPLVVFAATDVSLGGGQSAFPYSIAIDAEGNTVADLYEFVKAECRRGRGGASTFVFDAEGINGEQYIGEDLQAEYNTQTGAFVEGEVLYFHDSGDALVAQGTVVADHDDGATGDLIMRNTRFFTSNTITQVGDNATQGSYTDFATVASTRTITTPKSSPFGTFAGGTFFGAPGVVLTDVHADDVQAFQLVDDDGTVRSPPLFINATITGVNGTDADRVGIFVLDAPSGEIDRAQHGIAAPSGPNNGEGDVIIEVDSSFPNDTPESGTIRVVDTVNIVELRFRYASFTGAEATLANVAEGTGVTTADGTGTNLIDTSANFTNATDDPIVGDIILNITDSSWGVITSIDSATSITHTPLTGGTGDDWGGSDTYAINAVPYDLNAADTAYVPILDVIATGGDPVNVSSANLVYLADIPVLIRVRNGGSVDPILPFEIENTVDTGGLSQAAIRTSDTIAT
jgi:hypothetical protein